MSIEVTCRKCGEEFDSRRPKCPACGDAGASLTGAPSLGHHTTETLEAELKELSERIATDPLRFKQVAEELRVRRISKDEQPRPVEMTSEQVRENETNSLYESNRLLTLKVTEMEAEQARLVVEAEQNRQQKVEAEERLALVVRRIAAKREPMTRDAARELAFRHINNSPAGTPDRNVDWALDAIIEASR